MQLKDNTTMAHPKRNCILILLLTTLSLAGWAQGTLRDIEIDQLKYDLMTYDLQAQVTGTVGTIEGHVTVPATVEYAGKKYTVTSTLQTFQNCSGLTSVTLPQTLEGIYSYTFAGCTGLTEVEVPQGVTELGQAVFDGCTNLRRVVMPKQMKSISSFVFRNCTALEDIALPNGITKLDFNLFENCTSLRSIDIPEGVTTLFGNVFRGCTSLSKVVLPQSLTLMRYDDIFRGCTSLRHITLPRDLTITGYRTFAETGLEEVTIPHGWTTLATEMFEDCQQLKTLILPSTLTSMGSLAFRGCTALDDVYCYATTPPESVYSTSFGKFGTLHVPLSRINAYKNASGRSGWKLFSSYVPLEGIDLYDNEPFVADHDSGYGVINYHRTFSDTQWQPLHIPFSLHPAEWTDDFEVARISNMRQVDEDGDGKVDATLLEAFYVRTDTLRPNTPYLIRAKQTGEKVISVSEATLYATLAPAFDCASTDFKFSFTGNYLPVTADSLLTTGAYLLTEGSLAQTSETTPTESLSPYRWHMTATNRANGKAAALGRIEIVLQGGGSTSTGNESQTAGDVNGDGILTISDVTRLVNLILGKVTR